MHRKSRVLWLSIPLLASIPAAADTVVLSALKDNTLYEVIPAEATDGNGGVTSNGAGDFFFAGTTAQPAARRGLLAFDLAAIPAGAVVTDVTLTLEMTRTLAGPESITLHRVLADWGEGASNAPGEEGAGAPAEPGDATWLHTFYDTVFWGLPGGDFSVTVSAAQSVDGFGPYTWGSTPEMIADVQSWLDDPPTNYGWLVMGNESTEVTAKRFNSRENAAGAPELTVTFQAPVPTMPVGSLMILILTLSSVAVWGVRQRLRREAIRRGRRSRR